MCWVLRGCVCWVLRGCVCWVLRGMCVLGVEMGECALGVLRGCVRWGVEGDVCAGGVEMNVYIPTGVRWGC